uniref:Putative RING finger and transmembrane domain-containing protein 1-like n=1 Tax=Davidia involucrata TaxID=16924 RepID=A0A5B6Z7G9_DAVIN
METSENNSNSPVRFRFHIAASNFIEAPLLALLEYSGILLRTRSTSSSQENEAFIDNPSLLGGLRDSDDHPDPETATTATTTSGGEEVSIRIVGAGEQECIENGGASAEQIPVPAPSAAALGGEAVEGASLPSASVSTQGEFGSRNGVNNNINRDSSYQRYDIQQVAQWIEQVLPFSLLLLVVFIRQHLQGFSVTIWITGVLFKSNGVLRKQTALKGERKIYVLACITVIFMLHVVCVYWWYRNDDLLYPLVLLPPKAIPPFWHAIFIIMVNDIMVRQAAMVFKCLLLMYYKNSRGKNYRKQGQLLTLAEYMSLLYRALLPTPVWYRFFLNKEYGSLFSSLITGLYLTFKLTSVVEKVQLFFAALRALLRKEVHYGSYATSEQVNAAGDLCAICQEKMHAPILLRCKHIFCEDCVSEWFERERTCPLCRALVKAADIKSYADGSTNLFFQLS